MDPSLCAIRVSGAVVETATTRRKREAHIASACVAAFLAARPPTAFPVPVRFRAGRPLSCSPNSGIFTGLSRCMVPRAKVAAHGTLAGD